MESGNGAVIRSRSGSRYIAGRKESSRSRHVANQSDSTGAPNRRPFSISTFRNRLLSWWTRARTNTAPMIPEGLTRAEEAQYETLIEVVDERRTTGQQPPRVVAITDLAKDYDDLAAMVVLKELNRLGVVVLKGFVANLNPAPDRAQFGRGALDLLGLDDIPIAAGTSGYPDKANKKHTVMDYEFDCSFMAPVDDPRIEKDGADLLHRLCKEAVRDGYKLTLVLISSLEDIYTFSKREPELLKAAVSNIVFQGGYTIIDGELVPDKAAANNRYDIVAAERFHKFVRENGISSSVYTKVAAYATPLTSQLFAELAATKHPLGEHLRKVQVTQDIAFYKTASSPLEKDRFAPFMDREWFLTNRTTWFDSHAPEHPYPNNEEVVPYLTRAIVYDALAALGASGPDALLRLDVLSHGKDEAPPTHRIVGVAGPPIDPGLHPEKMATVLSALLKGSLLSCEQHIR